MESFLNKYEAEGSSCLHRAITYKLLQLGVFIPHWLLASYKVYKRWFRFFFLLIVCRLRIPFVICFQLRNPSELLRLLFDNGRLEESAQLAIDYAKAVLGHGKDHFNIKYSMLPHVPTTWLPLNIYDLILLELENHGKTDSEYKEVRLNRFYFKYFFSV